MGGSSSTASANQKYNNTVVNRSDLELLNQNVNNFTSNVVMKHAAECSANISQMNIFEASDMVVSGDFNANVDQSQNAAINFDCVQVSQYTSDIANGILDNMLSSLENNYSTEIMDKLNAAAQAQQTTGSLSTAIANTTTSNANIDYSSTQVNENRKSIKNLLSNTITNNIKMDDLQNCIANIKQSNKASFKNITVGGNAVLAVRQGQAATLVSKCIQDSKFANKIIDNAAKTLGLSIDEKSTTKKETTLSSEARSEQINTGLIQDLGNAVGSILSGIGDIFGNILGAFTGPIFLISFICVFCLCSFCILSMFSGGGKGEQQKGGVFDLLTSDMMPFTMDSFSFNTS